MNDHENTGEAKERLDLQKCEDRLQVRLHNQRFDFALRYVAPDDSVLEIGTGVGGFSCQLAEYCQKYTGLEFDPASAEAAGGRVAGKGKVIQGDARDLPFEPKSFSAVVCLEVLEHLGDFEAGVSGIHKCLTEDGIAVISVPYRVRGGKSATNPFHLYEPGERELVSSFQRFFQDVSIFYQYFPENLIMRAARKLHLRRFLRQAEKYTALSQGEPFAVSQLRISSDGLGMRMHLLLVAKQPRFIA